MAITNNVEFLRYLIDFIDSEKSSEGNASAITVSIDQGQEEPERVQQRVMPAEQPAFIPGEDGEEVDTALDRDDVFIPPLQAKLEMMKKLAGIEPKNQDLLSAEEDEPFEG